MNVIGSEIPSKYDFFKFLCDGSTFAFLKTREQHYIIKENEGIISPDDELIRGVYELTGGTGLIYLKNSFFLNEYSPSLPITRM